MDFKDMKAFLSTQPNVICNVLRELKAHGVALSSDNKRIQFGMDGNSTNRAHCVYLDSALTHFDYPNSIVEDFIQFVARMLSTNYSSAISFIRLFSGNEVCNLDDEAREYSSSPLIEYDNDFLDSYEPCISELFMRDGIPPTVQSIFDIRFSTQYNRILIPIKQNGKLVGLFGRYNQKYIDSEYIPKYFPILVYQKGKVLYPLDINGEFIRKKKSVFLVESEKTPMLCYKYNIRNVLALGGNSITSHQIEILKELGVENVCISLDKGLEDGYIQLLAIRLKDFGFKVSYIDVENIPYLKDKDCIFDLDDKELIKETIIKYRKDI